MWLRLNRLCGCVVIMFCWLTSQSCFRSVFSFCKLHVTTRNKKNQACDVSCHSNCCTDQKRLVAPCWKRLELPERTKLSHVPVLFNPSPVCNCRCVNEKHRNGSRGSSPPAATTRQPGLNVILWGNCDSPRKVHVKLFVSPIKGSNCFVARL